MFLCSSAKKTMNHLKRCCPFQMRLKLLFYFYIIISDDDDNDEFIQRKIYNLQCLLNNACLSTLACYEIRLKLLKKKNNKIENTIRFNVAYQTNESHCKCTVQLESCHSSLYSQSSQLRNHKNSHFQ